MMNVLRTALCMAAIMAGNAVPADTLRIGGTGVALGGMGHLAAAFEQIHPGTTVDMLSSLGSGGGVKELLAGTVDVGLISRPLKAVEDEAGASAKIYAFAPLAVVTSLGTQVDNVTTEDLEAMYSGTMSHWPDGGVIWVVMRPASETDTQLLRTLSDAMAVAIDLALDRRGLISATNDQENAKTLEALYGSIGLVALGQIKAEGRKLRILTLDRKAPEVREDFGLVAASGGIIAALDDDRTKLNLDAMLPNLTYLALDGTIEEQAELFADLHWNSIRHLAAYADGTIAFAM
jgi:phosphate transport system substrate-binding protein